MVTTTAVASFSKSDLLLVLLLLLAQTANGAAPVNNGRDLVLAAIVSKVAQDTSVFCVDFVFLNDAKEEAFKMNLLSTTPVQLSSDKKKGRRNSLGCGFTVYSAGLVSDVTGTTGTKESTGSVVKLTFINRTLTERERLAILDSLGGLVVEPFELDNDLLKVTRWDSCRGQVTTSFSASDPEVHHYYAEEHGEEDLSCIRLKAVSFPYEPFITSTVLPDGQLGYGGIEVRLINAICEKLGVKYSISPPSDGGLWGEEVTPGNFTGLVGDLQNNRADVGFAQLFMIPNRRATVDYTDTYEFDYVCCMIKKPDPRPQWYAMIVSFSSSLWGLVALSGLACVTFAITYTLVYSEAEFSPYTLVTCLIGVFVDESQPHIKRIKTNGLRVFVVFFVFACTVLTTAYRSKLTSNLSVQIAPAPIDTISEILSQPLPVSSFGDTFLENIRLSIDPDLVKLAEKYSVHYDFDGALVNASKRELIMCESNMFLDYSIRKRFTDNFGETSMHIMRECMSPYQVALVLQKDSPYTKRFSRVINRLREGGFVQKWIQNEMDNLAKLAPSVGAEAKATPWSVDHLQGPFFFYIICILCTLIVFIAERIFNAFSRLKM